MKQTLFIFGRTPDLSFLELQSYYPKATRVSDNAALVDEQVVFDSMIRLLGGTTKIVEIVDTVDTLSVDSLLPVIRSTSVDGHITFGISGIGNTTVPDGLLFACKKALIEEKYIVRFVSAKHESSLSSVVISKQHVTECIVLSVDGTNLIGITRAVQDFEDWNTRDFGRPAADPKRGMLPPKVARMIVAVSLGSHVRSIGQKTYTPTVFDPFCGVGTVVAEALLCGANAIGSDISDTAVKKTEQNIGWLRTVYPVIQPLFSRVFVSDATHIGSQIAHASIDAIATEPYMGNVLDDKDVSLLTPERVKRILKGLEKLYIGALREWNTVLKENGRIVMAIPAYVTPRGVMRVKNVIDRGASLGYTLLAGPIEYSRPQAVVKREFYLFQKK